MALAAEKCVNAKLTSRVIFRNNFTVVWRDGVVVPGKHTSYCSSETGLPPADPGAAIVHRWRKRLRARAGEWRISRRHDGLVASVKGLGKRKHGCLSWARQRAEKSW
jgi:hypothetical protein